MAQGYRSDDAVMAAVEEAIAAHGGAGAFAAGVISHISSQVIDSHSVQLTRHQNLS